MFRRVVVLLACICMLGCSSLRVVERKSPTSFQEQLHRGDKVRVTTVGHEVVDLTVNYVDTATLVGDDGSGATRKIALKDVQELQIRKTSVGKTAAAGVGITAAVLGTLVLVSFYAIAHSLDNP